MIDIVDKIIDFIVKVDDKIKEIFHLKDDGLKITMKTLSKRK
jgi:hypothetical protein